MLPHISWLELLRTAGWAAGAGLPRLPYGPAVSADRCGLPQAWPFFLSLCLHSEVWVCGSVFLQCLYNEFRASLPSHFYEQVRESSLTRLHFLPALSFRNAELGNK